MAAHAINKQSFEFSCNNETVARSVQYEIEHYTAFHINNIISSALDEYDEDEIIYAIDRLEINLGDVQLKEFGNTDMLDKFKAILNEKLSAVYKEKKYLNHYRDTVAFKDGKLNNETANDETDFKLLEVFLLRGDIPWWSDKNSEINFDAVIQKLAVKNSELLRKFLIQHRKNTDILSRLFEHCKAKTVSLINELVPGIMPAITSEDLFTTGYGEMPASLFSNGQLEKIKRLRKQRSNDVEQQKGLLLKKLIRLNELLLAKYQSLDFSPDEKEILPGGIFKRSGRDKRLVLKKNIRAFTDKLTAFQIEFLLFQLSLFSDAEFIERVHLKGLLNTGTLENFLFKLNDNLSVDGKHAIRKNSDTFFLDIVFLLNQMQFNYDADIAASANALDAKTAAEKDDLRKDLGQSAFTQTTKDNLINADTASSYLIEKKPQSDKRREPAFTDQKDLDKVTSKNDDLTTDIDEPYKTDSNEVLISKIKIAEEEDNKANLEIALKRSNEIEQEEAIKKPAEHEQDIESKKDLSVHQNTEDQLPGLTNKGAGHEEDVENKRGLSPYQSTESPLPGFTDKSAGHEQDIENKKDLSPYQSTERQFPGLTDGEHKHENLLSSENINTNFNDDNIISKKIDFLAKKLKIKSPAFTALLKQLREKDIDILVDRFKKRIQQSDTRKKRVENILEHPYFLKYNLLKLSGAFAHVAGTKRYTTDHSEKQKTKQTDAAGGHDKKRADKKEKTGRPKPPYSLSQKELIILKDVFNKGRFDSVSEKNIIKRLLLKLPEQNIALLKFFTELPVAEIQRLSVSNEHIPVNILPTEKQTDLFFNQSLPEKIYIENSGLCLITAYLTRFFHKLGYLENNAFKNRATAARALYVLQYIVTGKNKSPEYMLQLNKLLCGFEAEDYISASVRLTKKEMKEADDLLAAVIKNWNTLKNTSIRGFRQSFLLRKGILFDNGTSWTLQVERKGFDILLSTIPWGFGILKLPWMKKHIQVEW